MQRYSKNTGQKRRPLINCVPWQNITESYEPLLKSVNTVIKLKGHVIKVQGTKPRSF